MTLNDYVRTKDGKIGKYIQPDLGKPYITNGISFNEGANYGKHSKDIIDIIEVGDYVNGHKVDEVSVEQKALWLENRKHFNESINDKDIKSILTHEQFEANVYTIEKER